MRTLALLLAAASAAFVSGQQIPPEDETAIRRLTAEFHEKLAQGDGPGGAALFTSDGDIWDFGGWLFPPGLRGAVEPVRVYTGRDTLEQRLEKREAFNELSGPHVRFQEARLVAKDVALVDVTLAFYGSTIVRRDLQALMVVKKEEGDWRIASYRALATGLPSTSPEAQP